MNLSFKIPRTDEIDQQLEQSGLELLEYARWGAYRVKLDAQSIASQRELIESLLKQAYEQRG